MPRGTSPPSNGSAYVACGLLALCVLLAGGVVVLSWALSQSTVTVDLSPLQCPHLDCSLADELLIVNGVPLNSDAGQRNLLGATDPETSSIDGTLSVIVGGDDNKILFDGDNGTKGAGIVGGWKNQVSADAAVIVGGLENKASWGAAAVLGGVGNLATQYTASVVGGVENRAIKDWAVVLGGQSNTASWYGGAVVGGALNQATNTYATVLGGQSNTASGFRGAVVGGTNNMASGQDSAVVGGGGNFLYYPYSAAPNQATGGRSIVLGGQLNTASGDSSAVIGGFSNNAIGSYAAVLGGSSNTASGLYSVVLGGFSNKASASFAAVLGGSSNTASVSYAAVLGGRFNTASGLYSVVLGGYSNTISGTHTAIIGGTSVPVCALHRSIVFAHDKGDMQLQASESNAFAANWQVSGRWPVLLNNQIGSLDRTTTADVDYGRLTVLMNPGNFGIAPSNAWHIGTESVGQASYEFAKNFYWTTSLNSDTEHTGATGMHLDKNGVLHVGAVSFVSDASSKTEFAEVDPAALLDGVRALPAITSWRYINADDAPNREADLLADRVLAEARMAELVAVRLNTSVVEACIAAAEAVMAAPLVDDNEALPVNGTEALPVNGTEICLSEEESRLLSVDYDIRDAQAWLDTIAADLTKFQRRRRGERIGDEARSIGFMAQDLQAAFGDIDADITGGTSTEVNIGSAIGLLMGVVKAQQALIDGLEARVAALEVA